MDVIVLLKAFFILFSFPNIYMQIKMERGKPKTLGIVCSLHAVGDKNHHIFLPATLRNLRQLVEYMFRSWTNFEVLHYY